MVSFDAYQTKLADWYWKTNEYLINGRNQMLIEVHMINTYADFNYQSVQGNFSSDIEAFYI